MSSESRTVRLESWRFSAVYVVVLLVLVALLLRLINLQVFEGAVWSSRAVGN